MLNGCEVPLYVNRKKKPFRLMGEDGNAEKHCMYDVFYV